MKREENKIDYATIVYYVRIDEPHFDNENNIFYQSVPKSTVTLLIDPEGTISRGVAMCSHLDIFNKKAGRRISHSRALAGFETKKPIGPINRVDVFLDEGIGFKIEYNPNLTNYEQRLVDGLKKK